jgi:hypothetical protein
MQNDGKTQYFYHRIGASSLLTTEANGFLVLRATRPCLTFLSQDFHSPPLTAHSSLSRAVVVPYRTSPELVAAVGFLACLVKPFSRSHFASKRRGPVRCNVSVWYSISSKIGRWYDLVYCKCCRVALAPGASPTKNYWPPLYQALCFHVSK